MKNLLIVLATFLFGIVCSIAMGNGIQPITPSQPLPQAQPAPQPVQIIMVPTRRGGFMPYYVVPTVRMIPAPVITQPVLVPAHGTTRQGGLRGVVFGDVFRW